MGPIKRLGIVLAIIPIGIIFALGFFISILWGIIGILPATVVWIATGTWHDPMRFAEWYANSDPL